LPDPYSGRIYRLQVGAFSTLEAASRQALALEAIGFSVIIERTEPMYRVLAVDVPAAMVGPAVQRLGLIGVAMVWVRE